MKIAMRQFILAIGVFALLTSCNTDKKPDTSNTPAETATLKSCFESISKDTVQLALNTTGDKVTGTLLFKLHEKDKNEGTIEGEIKGDTLFADYTFLSEGVTSVREVVFLKRNDQLLEGFGEMTITEGKEVFKNRGALSFDNSLVLTATKCEN